MLGNIILILHGYLILLNKIWFRHVSRCLHIEIRFFNCSILNWLKLLRLLYKLFLYILHIVLLHGDLIVHPILIWLSLKQRVVNELMRKLLIYPILYILIMLIMHHLRHVHSLKLLVVLVHYIRLYLHLLIKRILILQLLLVLLL